MHTDIKKIHINNLETTRIKAVAGDILTRKIRFQFISNDRAINLTGCNVRVSAITSEMYNNEVFNDLVVVDENRGIAELELTSKLLTEGVTTYQLHIFKGQGILSSSIMELEVSKNLINFDAIESSNEFKALVNALSKIDAYDTRLRKNENEVTALKQSNSTQETNIQTNTRNIEANAKNIETNARNIETNAGEIKKNKTEITNINNRTTGLNITGSKMQVNNKDVMLFEPEVIKDFGEGGWVLGSGHIVTLPKPFMEYPNGIILVWSAYTGGVIRDYHFCVETIYKYNFLLDKSIILTMCDTGGRLVKKTVRLKENGTKLMGDDTNDAEPNKGMVLRKVLAI